MGKFFLLASAIVVCLPAFADDAPNMRVEKRMSDRANAQMNEAPMDPGVWNMITSQTSRKSYTTKRKESLKDVSLMLFGDSNFWGKLWSLNKSITNPYEVPVGTTINLIDATSDSPPSLGLVFNAFPDRKVFGDIAGPDLLGSSLNVEIPGNSHERPSAIENLPDSLPSWRFRQEAKLPTSVDFSRPVVHIAPAIKTLDYFVMESFPDSDAHVESTEMHLDGAGEFQYVYIKFDHDPTEKEYMVVKNLGKIVTVYSKHPPTLVGVLGTVQILEKVDAKKNIYRAMVSKTLDNIYVGASLIKGPLPTYEFSSSGGLSQANAIIIGGQHNTERNIFGTESVVFLDQGKKGGVAEGQYLPIYQYQRAKLDDSTVKQNPRNIGTLKVVKVMENFSTGVIIEANSEIEVGDETSVTLKVDVPAADAKSDDDVSLDDKKAGDDEPKLEEKPADGEAELKLDDENKPAEGEAELKLDDGTKPPEGEAELKLDDGNKPPEGEAELKLDDGNKPPVDNSLLDANGDELKLDDPKAPELKLEGDKASELKLDDSPPPPEIKKE